MSNMESLCRICVRESRSYKYIYGKFILDNRLFEIINELCHLDIYYGDGFPEYICIECYSKLLDFEKFKRKSHEGLAALVRIKIEIEEANIKDEVIEAESSSRMEAEKYELDVYEAEVVPKRNAESSFNVFCETVIEDDSAQETKQPIRVNDVRTLSNHGFQEGSSNSSIEYTSVDPFGTSTTNRDERPNPYYAPPRKRNHEEPPVPQQDDYKCDRCGSAFETKADIIQHTLKDCGEKCYDCSNCAARFDSLLDLNRHTMNCVVVVSNDSTVDKQDYGPRSKSTQCNNCKEWFNSPGYLKQHLLYSSCNNYQPSQRLSCAICGTKFITQEELEAHVKKHNSQKHLECSYCRKVFSRKQCLDIHVRIHTRDSPFDCSVCGKVFTRKEGLVTHIRIHTGEMPFLCNLCGKRFSDRSNWRKHMERHNRELLTTEQQKQLLS